MESTPNRLINVSSSSPFGSGATEMKECDRVIPSGPFKGKKIEFAPTTGVDTFLNISEDFMKKIYNFEPGEYLITDESSLFDFTGFDEMELTDIQKIIQDVYDVDVSDIASGNLLEIFMRIHHSKFADLS